MSDNLMKPGKTTLTQLDRTIKRWQKSGYLDDLWDVVYATDSLATYPSDDPDIVQLIDHVRSLAFAILALRSADS